MNDQIAALNDRKPLAHRLRNETEGMLCDVSGCTTFATHAIVPLDTHSTDDELDVDLACDSHHDEDADGFHVSTAPLSADVAALHALLGRR